MCICVNVCVCVCLYVAALSARSKVADGLKAQCTLGFHLDWTLKVHLSLILLPPLSCHSVWAVGIFGPFELHFQSFHADLEAIHRLDGGLSAGWVVKTHKSEAFALVGGTVNKHLSRDDIAKGQEHLQHLRVTEFLRQVVDEDVTALWTFSLLLLLGLLVLLGNQCWLLGERLPNQSVGSRVRRCVVLHACIGLL